MWRDRLKSCRAIARGAIRVLRDPRELARLLIASPEERERLYELEARALLNGLPRSVPIEAVVGRDLGRLETFSFLDDTSTVLDLLLLRALVRRRADSRYFEIGTFRGESAVAVADVASEVVTLSLPDDRLAQGGVEKSYVATHRVFSEGHPRIKHVFADSADFDVTPFQGWADVLFIDGDHSRQAVEADTRRFWSVRRPDSGVVVWHDGFLSPLRPRWEVLAGIAAGVPPEVRHALVHISNTLAIAWLPDAHSLPTVERSYVPHTAFSVAVKVSSEAAPCTERHVLPT